MRGANVQMSMLFPQELYSDAFGVLKYPFSVTIITNHRHSMFSRNSMDIWTFNTHHLETNGKQMSKTAFFALDMSMDI